jgi:hypothetical protein
MKPPIRPFAIVAATCLWLCVTSAYGAGVGPISPDTVKAEVAGTRNSPQLTEVKVMIPGPLRSFLRMAGISQKASPNDVLPLLARNTYTLGYEGNNQTEFLRLLNRYLHQARELQILAGQSGVIHVTNCDDAGTLVNILGYRLRQGCGEKNVFLETANPERAFLTIDSGFPLTDLEEALQKGVPFVYPYPPSWVPVLFHESDWVALSASEKRGFGNFIDVLSNSPTIARLYWALAKSDPETSLALQHSPGLQKLLPHAATLDFYGGQLSIHSGRVIVPGKSGAEAGWKE